MSKRVFTVIAVAIVGLYVCVGWLIAQQNRPIADIAMAGLPTQPFSHVVTKQLTVQSGGTTLQSNVDATGYDFTMDDLTATGNLTADGLIANTGTYTDAVSAAGFTGPITTTSMILGDTFTALRYGVAASVTDAMTITHNLGDTPLFVMLEPYGDSITVPVNVAISDTTSFTVNVPDGVTVANLIWFAGK